MVDVADESLERALARRERRLARLRDAIWRGPSGLEAQVFRVAWVVAVLARFTLADMFGAERLPTTAALALGTALVALRGGRVGWSVCAAALFAELVSGRDWLTQSMVMLFVAVAGALTADASVARSHQRLRGAALATVVATYGVAAFHKVNRDFLDPVVSCANLGWLRLDQATVLGTMPDAVLALSPWTVVVVEVVIALLLPRWPRLAIPLAAVFHVPLTLAVEPAFPFVMALGWVAALDAEELRAWAATARSLARPLAVGTAVTFGVLWLLTWPVPHALNAAKCAALLGLAALAVALVARAGPSSLRAAADQRPSRAAAALAALLFCANAATPYVGTQVQHAGAMLSNLRIDAGCWNHLLVPEAVRRVDPYVRIDAAGMGNARLGTLGAFADAEDTLRTTLWSTGALRAIRRNWCNERTAPIVVSGTFRGAPLELADLCDASVPLPRGPGAYGGDGLFDDYLRLQKNLRRACPSACVH